MENRDIIMAKLNKPWDVIVIGGGITGAGVFREAAANGLRSLLLEQRDFAWGASSRSGKLVHGGLRYLKQGQIKTTWHSVTEREKLLKEYDGLVEPLGFLVPTYAKDRFSPILIGMGLIIYDLMAHRWTYRRYHSTDMSLMVPGLKSSGMSGGFRYWDARTDDARLVLRVIREGVRLGGVALNYTAVEGVCRDRSGRVVGVIIKDLLTDQTKEVYAQVVINATGVWVDKIRSWLGAPPRMRPLRGSHLIFPRWRFPLAQAVGFAHPTDGRYVYAFPWEGVTLVGTTDVDHETPLEDEPYISREEGYYLLEGVKTMFPYYHLKPENVLATFSGVRPVVNTGQKNPSKESRDHCIWPDKGLITVTGGKLTTFALLARETMSESRKWLSSSVGHFNRTTKEHDMRRSFLLPPELGELTRRRLIGRYGCDLPGLIEEANYDGWEFVPGTNTLWAELRWAVRHEGVVHLDDLLLRRVRLGILLPQGGMDLLDRLRTEILPLLGWDAKKWDEEVNRYKTLWLKAYSPDLLSRKEGNVA